MKEDKQTLDNLLKLAEELRKDVGDNYHDNLTES